ncbi:MULTISPECIES: SAM-dependent methyltransferase [unclassified Kitasatospora]|uniref:SAM-dependent methyltransferase n=1 Tax=unclassified Kitasatospora TaxID=2633591 RepID=UPI00070D274A|nr:MULTISPECIES: SAM-dependent methyltransferase [unclassified Kitasatospora]KQV13227.1 hypothetical protein ASC99_08315 [Kitasatospora sp. Root107]KRB75324.1 hypothetical protein ASE03_15085 [Kitasatospora sp. Root187]
MTAEVGGVAVPEIDPDIPHVARVLDYLLGGDANFPADRAAAEQAFAAWPGGDVRLDICSARAALGRIVRHLAGDLGIRQFLDIGSGLPTADNTHQVARSVAPDAKVVYVDPDPLVIAHGRALLRDCPPETTAFISGDIHDPGRILKDAAAVLDFDRPIGVIMFGLLHFVPDEQQPEALMKAVVDALAPGSAVGFSHFARIEGDDAMDETFEQLNRQWGESVVRRTSAEAARLFFTGLEPIAPGVTELPDWRPEAGAPAGRPMPMWCGAAVLR